MDNQEYISSGILELYVLGQLSAEERSNIETLAKQDPAIKHEIENIEDSLHEYTLKDSHPLPSSLKAKTFSKIFGDNNDNVTNENKIEAQQPKVISIQRKTFPNYLIAASISLLIIFMGYAVFYVNQTPDSNKKNIAVADHISNPVNNKDEKAASNVETNITATSKKDSDQSTTVAEDHTPGTSAIAGNFYIVHIEGRILNKLKGIPMIVGAILSPKDQIEFSGKDPKAILMDENAKKFKMNSPQNTGKNYIAMAEDVISPLPINGIANLRGGEEEEILDLGSYFGSANFYIVGDRSFIKINKDNFPMTESTYFMYSYFYNGKTINKKIPYKNDTLFLDKKYLFESYDDKATIYYQDLDLKSSTAITSFKPIFLEEKTIKEEFKVQIDLYKKAKLSNVEIKEELYKYIVQVYGKTDRNQLEIWTEKNFPKLR